MIPRPLQKFGGNSNTPCVHNSILKEKSEWLERLFEEEEVFGVIQNFNVDKASSLDGYYLAFFQSSWSVIKANMMETFQKFLPTGNFKKKVSVLPLFALFLKRETLWRSKILGLLA